MAQFDIYENPNTDTAQLIPYFLDVQSNLLSDLSTRVVVPLCRPEAVDGKPMARLTPSFQIRGKPYVLLTPELAGLPLKELGGRVTNLARARDEIIAALDLLFTGI
ncbi:MAG TPA: CcdB family protein [Nevskiales bacterium]|nr:CcdB family protein [Nevskiales bacterium]